jgi:plasmid stabilization system protein ParE
VRLEVSARAAREIERALEWWAENRPDAPALLAQELDECLDRLHEMPDLGEVWAVRRGVEIRRVLLPRTKKKLYFT